ncbi:hypothetical protein GCM10023225_07750 [Kineococcus glutinatus]|uniref:Anti-anti-sigma factor n=1 Tax=Kineococcus glutinatus TaxID=1070872 RepID=A0ABP9HCZ9_9ACTN
MGGFGYDRATGQWSWSDELFSIFGFEPGQVVPTTALMASHEHPDDPQGFAGTLEEHVRRGHPFSLLHRLVDAAGHERWVTWVCTGRPADDAEPVRGVAADVSSQQQRAITDQANRHVSRALASREVIDQAKGVLMLVYRASGEEAFTLLRWASQRGNVKLIAIAERLLRAVRGGVDVGPGAREHVDDVFSAVLGGEGGDAGGGLHEPGAPADGSGARAPRIQAHLDVLGRAVVLRISGEVDLSTAPEFSGALTRLVAAARPPQPLVVDLRGATHLGSVGVAMLGLAHRRSESVGAGLRVVTGRGAAALTLTAGHGLDLYPSVERAVGG